MKKQATISPLIVDDENHEENDDIHMVEKVI